MSSSETEHPSRSVFSRLYRRLGGFFLALGVSVGAVVGGSVSAGFMPSLYDQVTGPDQPLRQALYLFLVQPGMGLVVAGYLWGRGNVDRYVRFRSLSLEGVGWMLLTPVAYWALTTQILRPLLPAFGLPVGAHAGDSLFWQAALEYPQTLFALPLFPIMALAEEVVYRGVVHGELRSAGFGVEARIVIGSLLFGIVHMFLSGGASGLSALALTGTGGLIFATAYERTDNLLVVVGAHALLWLISPISL